MSISLTQMNLWYCQLFSDDGESLEGVDEFEYGRGCDENLSWRKVIKGECLP
jgi:hypothetical protein